MITDYTLNTLIALAEAHEGCIPLHLAGISQVRTDEDLNVYIDMEDGRTLLPHEADEAQINEAIMLWRNDHGPYFQKILGAMM